MNQEPQYTGGIAPKTVTGLIAQVMGEKVPGLIPAQHGNFKVGIIGAGVAGLFTALVLDAINDAILEAAGEDRFGGRLYTHRFSEEDVHDYYDVGAMRFPDNGIMESDPAVLVPYYIKPDNGCPTYFNGVKKVGNFWKNPELENDPFKLNIDGMPEDQRIPDKLTRVNPSTLFEEAIKAFTDIVKKSFNPRQDNSKPRTEEDKHKLWELLMESDKMSVRQFLLSGKNSGHIPHGPSYNYNTVEWIETATYGTGWYDQSLTEAVLEVLDFDTKDEDSRGKPVTNWWCVDGGAQRIAEAMRTKLKDSSTIKYNTQVVGIEANAPPNERITQEMTLRLRDTATGKPLESKNYFTVINSATLGTTFRMDLSQAGLLWDTKQAIRCLNYGSSCKVGIKFKSAWWRKEPFNINKGGVGRTDLSLQVCVYPSYNIDNSVDPSDKPAVLLVSYTWCQTAQRLATLIASKGQGKTNNDIPREEAELKSVLLRDLAYLHASDPSNKADVQKTLDLITNEYMEHHAYGWSHDPHMAGAFAYFGPCQFSQLYSAITKPNAGGQLYFVGEAASAHHAWVVGALESVIRAIWLNFDALHRGNYEPYEWVMRLLERGFVNDEEKQKSPGSAPLPFYPLPAEMPMRQEIGPKPPSDGSKGDLLDHPEEKNGKDSDLLYGAAFVALSLVEFTLDNWLIPGVASETGAKVPTN
ncbi:hypothetical protein B0I35DRAFT_472320 [Stachybotrys elegans]|uniref:Amine oxidase domain-containing protein n=1 Tax=Stachybotrys elegans TaxID=80388 RepID=A0A8K0SAW5_9HYPO|nr:hypothetical protein B0I35DRAFT_472320 [Stachybotrys elegans]